MLCNSACDNLTYHFPLFDLRLLQTKMPVIKMIAIIINNSTPPSTGAPTIISRLYSETELVVGGCVGKVVVSMRVLVCIVVDSGILEAEEVNASITEVVVSALITEVVVNVSITEVVLVEEVTVLLLTPLNTAVKLTVHALFGSIKKMVIAVAAPLDIMLVDPVAGCELFSKDWHEWEIV